MGLTSALAEFFTTHDDLALVISSLQPANGSFLKDQAVTVQGNFSDNLSGIDVTNVVISHDGFPVTSQAVITQTGFTLNIPLTEDSHTVSVSVSDLTGNPASVDSNFTVDVIVPVISNLTPADDTGSQMASAAPSDRLGRLSPS